MTTQPQSCGSCRWASWKGKGDKRRGDCTAPIPDAVGFDAMFEITPTDGESCPCYQRIGTDQESKDMDIKTEDAGTFRLRYPATQMISLFRWISPSEHCYTTQNGFIVVEHRTVRTVQTNKANICYEGHKKLEYCGSYILDGTKAMLPTLGEFLKLQKGTDDSGRSKETFYSGEAL